jgi:hypothetical protein
MYKEYYSGDYLSQLYQKNHSISKSFNLQLLMQAGVNFVF